MTASRASSRILRAVPAALAAAVVVGLLAPLLGLVPVAPARAADTDLTLVTDARYEVDPAVAAVHVSVDIVATNNRRETTTSKFYFTRAYLAVLPGTTGFRVAGDLKPRVAVSKRTAEYTLLRFDFGTRLYNGESANLRLTFDLPDPGGSPDRQLRVGDSLVSFPIWAFASDGATGGTVTVAFPAGYTVSFEAGAMPNREEGPDGSQVFATGALEEPLSFFAYVVAERPGAYDESPMTVSVAGREVPLRLLGWADDPGWVARVGDLFATGLPLLGDEIGLPWPREDPVVVQEAVSRTAGGYAGMFDPAESRIEVAYWADPLVVLHEAAHGWFNGSLVGDRWASEGFASLYAERAAATLGVGGAGAALTPDLEAARIPLNAWGQTGSGDRTIEDFGYAASLELARAISERAGDEALRAVWADAAAGIGAYQPPASSEPGGRSTADPEAADGIPDWRGLLDLLEARAGRPFDDLWRTWVVREDEAGLLDARAAARASYARTLRLAGDWQLPPEIREALRAWRFDAAEALLADARTVLAQRVALETAAAASGQPLPPIVRGLFEGGGSLADASARAAMEFGAVATIEAAASARPADPDPITSVGLLGARPDLDLASARSALAVGNIDTAMALADAAHQAWASAWQEGRRRALLGLAVLATVLVLATAIIRRVRRHRHTSGPPTARRRIAG